MLMLFYLVFKDFIGNCKFYLYKIPPFVFFFFFGLKLLIVMYNFCSYLPFPDRHLYAFFLLFACDSYELPF